MTIPLSDHGRAASLIFFSAMLFSVAGCAHRQTKQEKQTEEAALKPLPNAPVMVYVGIFDLGQQSVRPDATGHHEAPPAALVPPVSVQELKRLTALLRDRIVYDLHDAHLPAQAIDDLSTPLRNGWLVTGEYFKIDEGDRLEKAFVGVTDAREPTRLLISVHDLTQPPDADLVDFNIDSRGTPLVGSAGSHGPSRVAGRFSLTSHAEESDIRRVAYQIANQIVALASRQEK